MKLYIYMLYIIFLLKTSNYIQGYTINVIFDNTNNDNNNEINDEIEISEYISGKIQDNEISMINYDDGISFSGSGESFLQIDQTEHSDPVENIKIVKTVIKLVQEDIYENNGKNITTKIVERNNGDVYNKFSTLNNRYIMYYIMYIIVLIVL